MGSQMRLYPIGYRMFHNTGIASPTEVTAVTPEAAFGNVLRRLRNERQLSQEALAFESGLERTFIARIETGRRQPTIASLFKLANGLDVSASYIVAEVEKELETPL